MHTWRLFRNFCGGIHLWTLTVCLVVLLFAQPRCAGAAEISGVSNHHDSAFSALRTTLAGSKRDTARVRVLVELGQLERRSLPEEAQHYAEEAESIARELHSTALHTSALLLLANLAIDRGMYRIAMQHALEAMAQSEKSGDDAAYARALGIVGTVHRVQNNIPKAFEYAWKALQAARKAGDKQQEAQVLSNLGSTHRRLRQYDSARYYRLRSLALYETLHNNDGIADACMGLGSIEEADKNPEGSIAYKRRALAVFTALGDDFGMADALTGIGKSYLSLQRLPGYADSAERVIMQGLVRAERVNARVLRLRAAEDLYRLYKTRSNAAEALRWYERFISLRDSIFSTEEATRLSEMQAGFDSEREAHERTLERWQRNMLLLSLALVLLLLGAVVNRFRLKQKSERQLQQKQDALEFEHSRAEALLANILPEAIANRLKMGETTIADAHQAATILFADIVGFTALTSRLPAREVVRLLDRVFSAFDSIAARYNLEKIKTIGDEYMVVAGIPQQNTNHTSIIAEAALEMVRAMGAFHAQDEEKTALTLRIGIHTGDVVAGVIGQKKFAYDLWGDTVNTASRMESHGVPQKIHCSEAVYEALKATFVFEERGEIEVKGKGTMRTYFLLGKRGNNAQK